MNLLLKFGPNTKSVADLRAEIRKNMQRELKKCVDYPRENSSLSTV